MNDKINIEIIAGVEGPCVSINDYRVAGPKPWGGGKVTKTWITTPSNILQAFPKRIIQEFLKSD